MYTVLDLIPLCHSDIQPHPWDFKKHRISEQLSEWSPGNERHVAFLVKSNAKSQEMGGTPPVCGELTSACGHIGPVNPAGAGS